MGPSVPVIFRGDFLAKLDHMCPKHVFQSGKRCEFFAAFPNHLQPWVSRVQETVLASKAEGTIRTYLADFKHWKLWALSNGFCYMPANTFHVTAYLQCLILKQILLVLRLYAVYCIDWVQRLASLPRVSHASYRFFYESSKTDQFRDGACVAIARSNQEGVFSNTLLPQRLILMRICRCLELYRLVHLLPKSGVKARAAAEPRRSLRTLLKTYQTFPL
ncbi:PREDICTED: uncharacterized protein LOC107346244 [Acropora digitifera]|uniref:uncharacterized protein LOC107346244 n=1 Tax=Acropora digitifera TaxID=70779 RepID=UPI00077AC3DD|nr:PREDICTED: uncharacterized protein LOC107346244 [Acropora digitifera]